MIDKPIKIEFREWEHTCGDGCCYKNGTSIVINGEEVEHHLDNTLGNGYLGNEQDGILSVLKHLGIKFEQRNTVWED